MKTYQVIIDSNYSMLIEAQEYRLRKNGTIEFLDGENSFTEHVVAAFSLKKIIGFTRLSDNIKPKANKG